MSKLAVSGALAIFLLRLFTSVSMAQEQGGHSVPTDAATVIALMKRATEPGRPTVRILTLKVNNP